MSTSSNHERFEKDYTEMLQQFGVVPISIFNRNEKGEYTWLATNLAYLIWNKALKNLPEEIELARVQKEDAIHYSADGKGS